MCKYSNTSEVYFLLIYESEGVFPNQQADLLYVVLQVTWVLSILDFATPWGTQLGERKESRKPWTENKKSLPFPFHW